MIITFEHEFECDAQLYDGHLIFTGTACKYNWGYRYPISCCLPYLVLSISGNFSYVILYSNQNC